MAADQFGVAHDAVGAEMREVLGLRLCVAAPRKRLRQHDAAAAVAARIEQQHVVVVERALEPARPRERARAREPGPALQEDEPGPAFGVRLAPCRTSRAKIGSYSPPGVPWSSGTVNS